MNSAELSNPKAIKEIQRMTIDGIRIGNGTLSIRVKNLGIKLCVLGTANTIIVDINRTTALFITVSRKVKSKP